MGLEADHAHFDCVLMGWNTYAIGLPHVPNPYSHLRQIVFTRAHDAPEGAEDAGDAESEPETAEETGEPEDAAE